MTETGCAECGATPPSHKRDCKTGSPIDAAIAATIERCAEAVEVMGGTNGGMIYRKAAAAAIRALKDKP